MSYVISSAVDLTKLFVFLFSGSFHNKYPFAHILTELVCVFVCALQLHLILLFYFDCLL